MDACPRSSLRRGGVSGRDARVQFPGATPQPLVAPRSAPKLSRLSGLQRHKRDERRRRDQPSRHPLSNFRSSQSPMPVPRIPRSEKQHLDCDQPKPEPVRPQSRPAASHGKLHETPRSPCLCNPKAGSNIKGENESLDHPHSDAGPEDDKLRSFLPDCRCQRPLCQRSDVDRPGKLVMASGEIAPVRMPLASGQHKRPAGPSAPPPETSGGPKALPRHSASTRRLAAVVAARFR